MTNGVCETDIGVCRFTNGICGFTIDNCEPTNAVYEVANGVREVIFPFAASKIAFGRRGELDLKVECELFCSASANKISLTITFSVTLERCIVSQNATPNS